jgi:Flp pilus assembly CpaE family ATPase
MAGRPGDLGGEDFATALGQPPAGAMPYLPQIFGTAANLGRAAWGDDSRVATAISQLARELSGQAGIAAAQAPAWKRWIGLAR